MVGELVVHLRQLGLRHVTRRAVLPAFRAGRGLPGQGLPARAWGPAGRLMTGQTLGVVKGGVGRQLLVRVVTGGAADALVLVVVALAVEDAVGLEADVL